MNFSQLKRAIIAKTKDKSNMPDWYYKRLEKCIQCDFNSGNTDKLSFKDKIRISHNFGKDACLKCTCGIEDVSSDPQKDCPEGFWKKEKDLPSNILNIITRSNKVVLTFNEKSNKYLADYEEIPYKFDSNIELLILNKDISELRVSTSCGCTTVQPKEVKEGTELIVGYDTLRVGRFDKTIKLLYKQNDTLKQTIVNIRGEVKKQNK